MTYCARKGHRGNGTGRLFGIEVVGTLERVLLLPGFVEKTLKSKAMKVRKLVLGALIGLGAAAAFTACQKEDKQAGKPKVEFRDAAGNAITTFNRQSFGKDGIGVYVTLGSESVKLKKLTVAVLFNGGKFLEPKEFSTKEGNSGPTLGKRFVYLRVSDLNIQEENWKAEGLKIVAVATDSQGQIGDATIMYKKAGSEAQGVPERMGWLNNSAGAETGGFVLTSGSAVKYDAQNADFVNKSEGGKEFSATISSNTGVQFAKAGDFDYAAATKESIAAAAGKAQGYNASIEGLTENGMFFAKSKDGQTFYAVKVMKVVKDKTKSYNGKEEGKAGSTQGNGGYMTFSYKSSK